MTKSELQAKRDAAAKKAVLTTYCDSEATAHEAFKHGWDAAVAELMPLLVEARQTVNEIKIGNIENSLKYNLLINKIFDKLTAIIEGEE